MTQSDITKDNGFDIDSSKGQVIITNQIAIDIMNQDNGTNFSSIKVQGLTPRNIEEQIINILYYGKD